MVELLSLKTASTPPRLCSMSDAAPMMSFAKPRTAAAPRTFVEISTTRFAWLAMSAGLFRGGGPRAQDVGGGHDHHVFRLQPICRGRSGVGQGQGQRQPA